MEQTIGFKSSDWDKYLIQTLERAGGWCEPVGAVSEHHPGAAVLKSVRTAGTDRYLRIKRSLVTAIMWVVPRHVRP